MEPIKKDLKIFQGKSFSKSFRIKKRVDSSTEPWPSGTLTWRGQIRDSNYDTKIVDLTISATTGTQYITVTYSLTPTQTSSISVPDVSHRWDLECYRASDGWVGGIYYGSVFIIPEATK